MLKHLDNGNLEITLVLPWSDIVAEYERVVRDRVGEAEIPGFRKGRAPREKVEPGLDKNQLYSQALQKLLPASYTAAVKKLNITPIVHPQIKIANGKLNQDWTVVFTTCEAPQVKLPPGYQRQLKGAKQLPEILERLAKLAPVEIPQLLAEEEANHRLAHLAENLSALGMTTDRYLETKKLTPEDLRAQILRQAQSELGLEFVLKHIQTLEKLPDRAKTLDFLQSML